MRADGRSTRLAWLAALAVLPLALAAPASAQQEAAATPTARPAGEAAPGGGGGGGEPIEIVADRLVVEQDQQLATFSGNVDAVQGDLSLRADRLRVFYADQGEGGARAGNDQQSIRRIEADGNVLLTRPSETAEGNAGVYDPVAGTLVLEGNVVLTRGQNVVRGNRLDSNLETGVSVVTAAQDGERDQRVRALFRPEQNAEGP